MRRGNHRLVIRRHRSGRWTFATAAAVAAAWSLVLASGLAFAAGGPVNGVNWNGGTVQDTGAGAIFTKTNWGGSGETVVLTSSISNSAYFNNGGNAEPTIGGAPAPITAPGHNTLHFDAPKTSVTVRFNFLGTNANESLANISPAFASMSGAGTPAAGNTGVNPTTADGTVILTWPGPVQDINFDHVTPTGGASTVGAITYTSTSITLTKALSGSRFAATDQFTTQIRQGSAGGPVVSSATNATTTGTGSTVTAGTGTTGALSVGPGGTYFLTEQAAGTTNLARYRATMTCVDSRGLQTGLPTNVDAGSPVQITPVAGANITCTLTNHQLVPHLSLDKQVSSVTDTNANGLNDPGDVIHYGFAVTNDGESAISGISVSDPQLGAVSCPGGTVNPGASVACATTASHTIDLADAAAGSFTNTATASGQDPFGTTVTSPPDSTTTPTPGSYAFTLDKRVAAITDTNGNSRTDAGDSITWEFEVSNTGTLAVNTPSVSDPRLSGAGITPSCPGGSIAPGASVLCTAAAYPITQADVDAGPALTNTATATVRDRVNNPLPPTTDSTSTSLDRSSLLTLDKRVVSVTDTNGSSSTDTGDRITWAFDVRNAGSTTLTGPSIDDPFLTAAGITVTCPPGSIAPGATVTCTAPAYPISQDDIDDGGDIVNSATAHASNPGGNEVVSAADSTTTPVAQDRSLALDKKVAPVDDANNNATTDAGDRITWTFDVTNTGSATLHDPSISDQFLTDAGIVVTCPTGPIAPGATVTCTAPAYTISQLYIDDGGTTVTNTATASADDPAGVPVDSLPDYTSTGIDRISMLSVDKSIKQVNDVNSNASTDAGDTVEWEFEVTNLGTTTLTDPRITDGLLAGNPVTCDQAVLAPGESTTCAPASAYVITQSDIDNGGANLTNTATATAEDPEGDAITSPGDSTQTPLTKASLLTLDKRVTTVTDVNNNASTDAGDTIEWEFDVTNIGTTTLNTATVTDPFLTAAGVTVTCPTGNLAPNATVLCTAPAYEVTQDDIDNGPPAITNTAIAHASGPTGQVDSTSDSTQTPVTQSSLVKLDKRVVEVDDLDSNGTDAGDTIEWAFDVTNIGTTTLTAVTVTDPFLTAHSITVDCSPGGPLAPGETLTCTAAPYAIVQDDVDAGPAIINTAAAHAEDPSGTAVHSASDSTQTPTAQVALLKLDKRVAEVDDVDDSATTNAGDTVTWDFVLTNSGTVSLTNPSVTDPFLTANSIAVDCAPGGPIAPGGTLTCTSDPYEITQANIDSGPVLTNTATAHATDPGDVDLDSAPDTAETGLDRTSLVGLDKRVAEVNDVNNNGTNDAGDTIDWEFDVTNIGTTTLDTVTVTDPFLTAHSIAVDCSPGGPLAPGDTLTCTADAYAITQDDVDNGPVAITNTATASAVDPDDATVTSPTSSTQTPLGKASLLGLTKRVVQVDDADHDGRTDTGDTITWAFDVKNTGTTTLHAPSVTDDLLGAGAVTCPIAPTAPIAPGATVTCTAAAYRITQADVDTSSAITNTATASALNSAGTRVDSQASTTQTPLSQSALIGLDKRVVSVADVNDNGRTDAGDTITWAFDVTNDGTQSLHDLEVTDAFLGSGAVTCPDVAPAAMSPRAAVTCTAPAHTITQAEVDNGSAITNTASAHASSPDDIDVDSAPSTTVTPLTVVSQVALDKRVVSVDDANGNGRTDAGDTITWAFDLTNDGTTTLRSPIVDDPFLDGADIDVTCPGAPTDPIAPGATLTCSAPAYTITQDDIDHGGPAITNRATAAAEDPAGDPVLSAADTTATPVVQVSLLTLDKRVKAVEDVNGNARTDAGDKVTWEFEVTNSGTRTLTDPTVTDSMFAVQCPTGDLLPGGSVLCTAPAYTVTQDEIDNGPGVITNTATANAVDVDDATVASPTDTTTTPLTQVSTLTLEKRVTNTTDANHTQVTDAGDTITWAFDVTNSGTTNLDGLVVSDPMLTAAGISVTCPTSTLAPGAKVTCTHVTPYTITKADASKGAVTNSATAQARNASTAAVASTTDSTRTAVLAPQDPAVPTTPKDLPETGGPSSRLLGAALVLLGLGVALVLGARRRT